MKNSAIIVEARTSFHRQLVERGVLSFDDKGIPSNADGSNKPSCAIATLVAQSLKANCKQKLNAQTAGTIFEELVCDFLKATFPRLQHLRPGNWEICNLGNKNAVKTASFAQYEHLAALAKAIKGNQELATIIGNELVKAVHEYGKDDRQDLIDQLEMLIDGKRLKDISDLPLDLAC